MYPIASAFGSVTHTDLYVLIMFLTVVVMQWFGKIPTPGQTQDYVTVLNSRGGNILLLAAASVYFFYRSEVMYYTVINLINSGKIAADNGVALNGLAFDTGLAGLVVGALLKTMSPDSTSPAKSTDTVTLSTIKTVTPTNPQPSVNNASEANVTQANTDVAPPTTL